MKLVLLRHGIAIEREDPGCPLDEDRWLTKRGIKRTVAALHGVATLEVEPDLVLTSPLLRARETAQIAAEVLGCGDVRVTEALRGGSDPQALFVELARLEAGTVVCVGHAPLLDLLLEACLPPVHGRLEPLKKSAAALVELARPAPHQGRLVWLMQPRALRALGGE